MPLTPLTGAATLTVKVGDFNAMISALNAELDDIRAKIAALPTKASVDVLTGRVAAIENTPHEHGALADRVAALEALIVRSPAESPGPSMGVPEPSRPPDLDTSQPQLVYNQVTLYYGDIELHAQRIGERRWLLRSRLNYIVISPAEWTYEEIIEGDPDEIYAHAQRRLVELAELKPQHDAVHARVRDMSEGRP